MNIIDFVRQAFGSPGGKSRVAEKIIKLIPEHRIYTEVFAGGAAIFFKKKISHIEVLNDLNSELSFTFKFMRDITNNQIDELKKYKWDASETYFNSLKKTKPKSDIERFHRFIYLNRFSYGRIMKNYYGATKQGDTSDIVNRLPGLKERLHNVKIYSQDYAKILLKYDSKNTFHFIDPPYPKEWASQSDMPKNDMFSMDDVQKLANVLKNLKGKWILTLNIMPEIKKIFSKYSIRRIQFPRSLQKKDTWHTKDYEYLIANYDISNVKFSELEFIKDVAGYNPQKLNNEQLADDWRIVMSWFSIYKKTDGKDIGYSREDIVNLAKIIYDEIISRVKSGKMKHDFKPEEMQPNSRELFNIVSKGREVPFAEMEHVYLIEPHAEMSWKDEKTLIIQSSDSPNMVNKPLILCDRKYAYGVIRMRPADKINKTQFEELKERHKVSDGEAQKWWNDIDTFYSYEFEWIEKYKKPKPIKSPKEGQMFSQSDINKVLEHFKDMTIINRFISIAGGFIEKNGKNYNDIDIIVRMGQPNDFIKRAIESRLNKDLPKEIADSLHIVFDPEGPHSKFIPLYDLSLSKSSERTLIEMAQQLSIMRPYSPQKPYGSAYYKIEDILKQIKENEEYSIEFKFNGFHASVHKQGDRVKIFSEHKKDLTNSFPTLINDIKKLSDKDFIIDGELVPYDKDGNMLGRNVLMKYLGKGEKDDSNIKFHVWDILYYGG